MKHIAKKISLIIGICLFSLSAWALDIDQAKSNGWIGETPSGYVAAIKQSSEVKTLVSNINQKRKVKYQEIANQHKVQLEKIERLAGEKLVNKALQKGQMYMSNSGQWLTP